MEPMEGSSQNATSWTRTKRQRQPRTFKSTRSLHTGSERKYAQSFCPEENAALVTKLCQYYNYILGEAAKKTTSSKRNHLWMEIVDAVNAAGGNNRTLDVVKKRYSDIRRMVKKKMCRAAAASRNTGSINAQKPSLFPYEEEFLQFMGRDSLLGIEGMLENDNQDANHSLEEEGEREIMSSAEDDPLGPYFTAKDTATGQAPVSREELLASFTSHTNVPMSEENDEAQTIVQIAVDPTSVKQESTFVAIETPQLPQMSPNMAALYNILQTQQSELENSVLQDRDRQKKSLEMVMTQLTTFASAVNMDVGSIKSTLSSIDNSLKHLVELWEEDCILRRVQLAHSLSISLAGLNDLVEEERARRLYRRDDDLHICK